MPQATSTQRNPSQQRGFTIVELTIVLAIASIMALYSLRAKTLETDYSIADMVGVHVDTVAGAAEAYTTTHYLALTNVTPATQGSAIAGVANAIAPTLAELKAKGHLLNSFPDTTPLGQSVAIAIQRNNCPGTACQIRALAYTTSPMHLGGASSDVRYDLLVQALQAMRGRGGMSAVGNGGTLTGATFNTPNPLGNVEGILAGSGVVDNTLYNTFVRLNDTRDPNLQGDLTVAGAITSTAGNVGAGTGTDASNVSCRRAEAQSIGAFIVRNPTCLIKAGIQFLSTGETEVFADNLRNNTGTAGIKADGNVYASTGTIAGAMTAATVNTTALNTTGAATVGNLQNAGNTAGVTASGTQYGAVIRINNSAIAGSTCSNANDIVRTSIAGNPALLICSNGLWALSGASPIGSPGGACAVIGSSGVTATGIALFCVNGQWATHTDRFGRFAGTDNYANVGHGSVIPKPACAQGGAPKIYFVPQGVVTTQFALTATTSNYVANFRAYESGNNFIVIVDDTIGYGVAQGNPVIDAYAMVLTGCYYN